jgi:hypothetical protein
MVFRSADSIVSAALFFTLLLEAGTLGCDIRWYKDLNETDGTSTTMPFEFYNRYYHLDILIIKQLTKVGIN